MAVLTSRVKRFFHLFFLKYHKWKIVYSLQSLCRCASPKGMPSSAKSLAPLGNNFVREAEGCRWELKARNSAVQLCPYFGVFCFFAMKYKGTNISDTNNCNAKTFEAKNDVAKINPQKFSWIYSCNNNFCVKNFCVTVFLSIYFCNGLFCGIYFCVFD